MSQQLEDAPQYDADPASPLRDPAPVPGYRRAAYIIAFFAAVFAIDRGVAMVLEQLAMRSQHRYSILYSGRGKADVLIVGNSRGLHSLYAPEMSDRLGTGVFNLSSNGIGMDVAEVVIADYLDRNPAPKMVLVEVTSLIIPPGDTIGAFQPFLGASDRVQAAFRKYAPERYWAANVCHSYRFNGQALEKFLLYLRKDDQHWISPAERRVAAELLAHREMPAEAPIDPTQIEAWKRLVAAAEAKGVKVVPFVAPYLQGALGTRDLGTEYRKLLMPGLADPPVLHDYSRAVQPDEAFSDRVHTNVVGARLLFEAMVEDGIFEGLK